MSRKRELLKWCHDTLECIGWQVMPVPRETFQKRMTEISAILSQPEAEPRYTPHGTGTVPPGPVAQQPAPRAITLYAKEPAPQPEAEPRKDIKAVLGKWLDHGRYTVCGMRLANGQRAPCHCGLDAAIESLYAKEPAPHRDSATHKVGSHDCRWFEISRDVSSESQTTIEYYCPDCKLRKTDIIPITQQHTANPVAVARHKGDTPETDEIDKKVISEKWFGERSALQYEYSKKCRSLEFQRNELRAENESLATHALAIEDSVNRLKEKAVAEHKDHPFCPHCSPCRHGEKLAALTAENERLRAQIAGMK